MVMEAPDLQQRDRRADTSIQRAWTYKGRIIVKMLTTTADDPTSSIRFAEFNPDPRRLSSSRTPGAFWLALIWKIFRSTSWTRDAHERSLKDTRGDDGRLELIDFGPEPEIANHTVLGYPGGGSRIAR
jgi:hypothetical protein